MTNSKTPVNDKTAPTSKSGYLCLSRKMGQSITIFHPDGTETEIVQFKDPGAKSWRVGIKAPATHRILRTEKIDEHKPEQPLNPPQ